MWLFCLSISSRSIKKCLLFRKQYVQVQHHVLSVPVTLLLLKLYQCFVCCVVDLECTLVFNAVWSDSKLYKFWIAPLKQTTVICKVDTRHVHPDNEAAARCDPSAPTWYLTRDEVQDCLMLQGGQDITHILGAIWSAAVFLSIKIDVRETFDCRSHFQLSNNEFAKPHMVPLWRWCWIKCAIMQWWDWKYLSDFDSEIRQRQWVILSSLVQVIEDVMRYTNDFLSF